jgi:hypothetical protein
MVTTKSSIDRFVREPGTSVRRKLGLGVYDIGRYR